MTSTIACTRWSRIVRENRVNNLLTNKKFEITLRERGATPQMFKKVDKEQTLRIPMAVKKDEIQQLHEVAGKAENEHSDVGPALYRSAAFATVGAFLFGYHSGVINAPLEDVARDLGFAQDTALKGFFASVMVVGGVLGGLGIGPLSDNVGRKNSLSVSAIPLVIGPLINSFADTAELMLFGRFLTGIGVGASSALVPLYLSEVAPTSVRGLLGSVRRIVFVLGCLSAFALPSTLQSQDPGWWRPLFLVSIIPPLAQLCGTWAGLMEESPVWLLAVGRHRDSRRALTQLQNIRGREAVEWQRSAWRASLASQSQKADTSNRTKIEPEFNPLVDRDPTHDLQNDNENRFKKAVTETLDIFQGNTRRAVTTGLGLCFLQSFSGSNTIIYYAASVFSDLGITKSDLVLAVGVPNLLGAVAAMYLMDRWGRRPLLQTSFACMSLSFLLLAAAASTAPSSPATSSSPSAEKLYLALPLCQDIGRMRTLENNIEVEMATLFSKPAYIRDICRDLDKQVSEVYPPILYKNTDPPAPEPDPWFSVRKAVVVTSIPVFVFTFSAGVGPVPWLLYNEIFPTRIRARAMALCTSGNYICNVIIGTTFLPAVEAVGISGTYAIYGLICLGGLIFSSRYVVETKGLSLQEIEILMASDQIDAKLVPVPVEVTNRRKP